MGMSNYILDLQEKGEWTAPDNPLDDPECAEGYQQYCYEQELNNGEIETRA